MVATWRGGRLGCMKPAVALGGGAPRSIMATLGGSTSLDRARATDALHRQLQRPAPPRAHLAERARDRGRVRRDRARRQRLDRRQRGLRRGRLPDGPDRPARQQRRPRRGPQRRPPGRPHRARAVHRQRRRTGGRLRGAPRGRARRPSQGGGSGTPHPLRPQAGHRAVRRRRQPLSGPDDPASPGHAAGGGRRRVAHGRRRGERGLHGGPVAARGGRLRRELLHLCRGPRFRAPPASPRCRDPVGAGSAVSARRRQ